jgi:hypothetical protein
VASSGVRHSVTAIKYLFIVSGSGREISY